MRTFAQKPKGTQQTTSAKSTKPSRSLLRQSHNVRSILQLQRTIGNQAVLRLLQTTTDSIHANSASRASTEFSHDFSRIPVSSASPVQVQPKLTVSAPGDAYEQEADRVADAIIRMDKPVSEDARQALVTSAVAPRPPIQRQVEQEAKNHAEERQHALELNIPEGQEEDGIILPKSLELGVPSTFSINAKSLGASRAQMLPSTVRKFMEPRFGHDFSSVRIHTDSEAAGLASTINAAAFTHGRHIYFGRGRFNEHTENGRRLLAHELTHVVQQRGGDNYSVASNIQRSLLRRPEIRAIQGGTKPQFWRAVEAHVNLRQPQRVRIYNGGRTPQDFETSAGTGNRTSRLISRNPYPIIHKRNPPTAKRGRWGLQYFAWFTPGGVGFHSKFCFPRPSRRRQELTVDGTPHSHGCMRLHHGDAQTVYNDLSEGDNVYIYDRAAFRSPSWGSSTSPRGSSTGRRYVVVAGDTLSEIAARFGVSTEDIARANGISDIESIREGQELTIPEASE